MANTENQELIILRILAQPKQPFTGYELLKTFLANELKFGEMDIFHYYAHGDQRSPTLFSLASLEPPGSFNLTKMSATNHRGITLFMEFDKRKDLHKTFDIMLQTANLIAEDLNGKVLDNNNQIISKEAIAHMHTKIDFYLRNNYTYDLFNDNQA